MWLDSALRPFPGLFRPRPQPPLRLPTKLNAFQPRIQFNLAKGRYAVRTAGDPSDLARVLRLRHEVFYEELLHRATRTGLDWDRYDLKADHLMVEDQVTGRLIGTYRVITSLHSNTFYSQSEFKMRSMLALPGVKMELGRACVHPDHRNGATILLLWRGISAYLKACGARWLFGCSSLKAVDPVTVNLVYRYLHQNHAVGPRMRVRPRRKFRYPGLDRAPEARSLTEAETAQARERIPSLLQAYLRAGAVVGGEPALDRDFQCVDFFTLLDVSRLDAAVERKYQVC
jgi:putative hemolysin